MPSHPGLSQADEDLLVAARGELRTCLDEAITSGVCSGLQLEIGHRDRPLERLSLGTLAGPGFDGHQRPVEPDTRFDVASLTKALAVSLVAMRATAAGRLDPGARLATLIAPGLLHPTLRAVAVTELLRHRSGLLAWHPFFERVPRHLCATDAGLETVRRAVAGLVAEPAAAAVYSDPNYILLDWVLEWTLGTSLDVLFQTHVAEPLGLRGACFVDLKRGQPPLDDAPATEDVAWRGGVVRGTVHDDNCYAMGGVSGHAGLFASAADVGRIARALLETDAGSRSDWIAPDVLHHFWDRRWLAGPDHSAPGGSFVLGWDTPSGERSSAGRLVNRERTVGHLGFTGCSLWIDRERAAYAVFLTNRVHPSRDDDRLRDLRPRVSDLGWEIVDANAAR